MARDQPTDHDPHEPDPGSIIAPSPVVLLGTFLCGVAFDRRKRVESLPRPLNAIVGIACLVAGTGLFVGAIRTMRRAGTGPSHADEPASLLTEGVFGYSRNPIYLGNCLQYVGLSLLYNSLWPLVLLAPAVAYLDRVVAREERYLEATFDEEYRRYSDDVGRWF